MKYHYSKYKFSDGLFYKRVDSATIDYKEGIFQISVLPFFNYSGKYHIHSVAQKDGKRTLFRTIKSKDDVVDLAMIGQYHEFFVSISHDGRKAMVFDSKMNGVILKV